MVLKTEFLKCECEYRFKVKGLFKSLDVESEEREALINLLKSRGLQVEERGNNEGFITYHTETRNLHTVYEEINKTCQLAKSTITRFREDFKSNEEKVLDKKLDKILSEDES